MTIDQLLLFAAKQHAADLYFQTGTVPRLRIGGLVREFEAPKLTDDDFRGYIRAIAPRNVAEDINTVMARGFDFSYALGDHARFRCNLYSHLGGPGLVIRVIPPQARTLADLHLPPALADFARARRGLTLLSGTTGSGKSSTLAALVDLLNTDYHIKILTIEDPVEFVHASKKALVTHEEVGADTPSFEQGLRQAMRQAPDVILVGELRDAETVRMALRAADTGHQVLSTVHSSNAAQTVERLLAMVPPEEMSIARQQLAASLVGVISQRLAMSKQGALWPVVEILRGDAVTAKDILEGKLGAIADYIATGERGMQTFDKHAIELYEQGVLGGDEALRVATNPDAVAFGIRVSGAHDPAKAR
jgi:twitching motility protein PilT